MTSFSPKSLEDREIQEAGEDGTQSNAFANACHYLLSTKGKNLRSSILLEAAINGDNSDLVRRAAVLSGGCGCLHYGPIGPAGTSSPILGWSYAGRAVVNGVIR